MKKLSVFLILVSMSVQAMVCDLHIENLNAAFDGDRVAILDLRDQALAKGFSLHADTNGVQPGDYVISPFMRYEYVGWAPTGYRGSGTVGEASYVNARVAVGKKTQRGMTDIVAVDMGSAVETIYSGTAKRASMASMKNFLNNLLRCDLLEKRALEIIGNK